MIALFWTRIGTETARSVSGSVEEYERALERHRRGEPIEIGIYFKMSPPSLVGFNPQQYQGVLDLRTRLETDGVYVKKYLDDQSLDFEINLLLDRLARRYGGGVVSTSTTVEVEPSDSMMHSLDPLDEASPDIGLIDVLESLGVNSTAANAFLEGATEKIDRIHTITLTTASRMEELGSLGPLQPADMKPLIADVTCAFDDFSNYIEAGIDDYAVHSASIAENTRNMINVSRDFETRRKFRRHAITC
jgi:hypothetical protein